MSEPALPRTSSSPLALERVLLAAFSFASGLFFFGCMKLMSFHWITVSVLISFLLIGMPLGGFVAVRFLPEPLRAMRVGLLAQAAAMLFTLLAFPVFLDPGTRLEAFLNGTLAEGRVAFVLDKFLQLALLFLPYFVTFGLNEFSAYRLAIPSFRGRSEWAYALFLGATSVAYIAVEYGAVFFGVLPVMLLGIAAVGGISAGLTVGRRRTFVALASLPLVAAAAVPGLEDRYIGALEHDGAMNIGSVQGKKALHRSWGRYCHLTVVEINDQMITGYYNGGLHWFHRSDMTKEQVERDTTWLVPFSNLPETGGRVLIIGAGGGEQVRTALMTDPAKVVAVEIIPEVLEVLGGELDDRTSGVYTNPVVEPVAMDGRRYLDGTDEKFDLIYLPTVDTDISMMRTLFNSAETLYTVESFQAMREHLTENGAVVIQRPAFFDVTGKLLRQYFKGLEQVGLHPVAWVRNPVALGQDGDRTSDAGKFDHEKLYMIFGYRSAANAELPPDAVQSLESRGFVRVDDFGDVEYEPKTDDFLFRSDMMFQMSAPIDRDGWRVTAVFLLLSGAILGYLWRLYRTSGDPGPVPFPVLVVLGILIGVNFLLVEQFLVYKLYRVLDRPMDAMFVGTVGFLLLTGAGGIALTTHARRFGILLALSLGLAGILALRWVVPETPLGILVALPVFVLTGSLFPSLFRGSQSVLLVVFVADALGAAVAGVFAFVWPIFYGFQSYDRMSLMFFALTAVAVLAARQRYGVQAEA